MKERDAASGCVPFCFGGVCGKVRCGRLADVDEGSSGSRDDERGEQKDGEDAERGCDQGAERDAAAWAGGAAGEAGDVAAEDVSVAGEGLVGFVDGVAAEDEGAAIDAGLGVDDGVAAEYGGVSGDAAGDGEVAEQDKGAAGKIALYLHGAEDAGGVVDLLRGGDKDVLAEVGAVGWGSGWSVRRAGRALGEGSDDEEQRRPSEFQEMGRQRRLPSADGRVGAVKRDRVELKDRVERGTQVCGGRFREGRECLGGAR